jgi:hypothetical protein
MIKILLKVNSRLENLAWLRAVSFMREPVSLRLDSPVQIIEFLYLFL